MLEGRGDNFDSVSTDRLKLELPEEMHLRDIVQLSVLKIRHKIAELETKLNTDDEGREKRSLENQAKVYALRLEQESKISGSYQVSQRKQMDQLHKMKENLVKTVRCNSVNQKTMNAMRGPVKKISRSSRLSKLNL